MRKRIFIISFSLACMIGVRLFQNELFYDPMSNHFSKNGTSSYLSVHINLIGWSLSTSLRYAINGVLSCSIIAALSTPKEGLNYILVYFSFLPFILGLNLIVMTFLDSPFLLFYSLRLLIQPIIGLVLIGSFYYNKTAVA